jgi:hypothetical protein
MVKEGRLAAATVSKHAPKILTRASPLEVDLCPLLLSLRSSALTNRIK